MPSLSRSPDSHLSYLFATSFAEVISGGGAILAAASFQLKEKPQRQVMWSHLVRGGRGCQVAGYSTLAVDTRTVPQLYSCKGLRCTVWLRACVGRSALSGEAPCPAPDDDHAGRAAAGLVSAEQEEAAVGLVDQPAEAGSFATSRGTWRWIVMSRPSSGTPLRVHRDAA